MSFYKKLKQLKNNKTWIELDKTKQTEKAYKAQKMCTSVKNAKCLKKAN